MPDWTSPGVYGRYPDNAGRDLVTELMADRSFINSIIETLWNEDQKKSPNSRVFRDLSLQEMKAELWYEIISSPETSGVLRLALKSILVRQASGKETKNLPGSSAKFLKAFENAVTKYRSFLVVQSKAAFKLWDARALERDFYKSNQTVGETVKKGFFAMAMLPWPPQSVPDFRGEAEQLTLDLQVTEASLKMYAISESLSPAFRKSILPVSYTKALETVDKRGAANRAVEEAKAYLEGEVQGQIEARITTALTEVAERTTKGAASKVAEGVLKLAKFVEGPLVVVDVILQLQETYGEVIIDRLTMSKQYDNALELMQTPYSLKSALVNNSSTGEFDLYFNVITHNKPKDKIQKISPPSSWATELCGKGELVIKTGAVTGVFCNMGCPAAGAQKTPRSNGQCDLGKAAKYVDSVFVAESNTRHSCPDGSYFKQDDVKRFKGCMSCPAGYEKYGNWDMSKSKSTSTNSKYGECVFSQEQVTVAPVF